MQLCIISSHNLHTQRKKHKFRCKRKTKSISMKENHNTLLKKKKKTTTNAQRNFNVMRLDLNQSLYQIMASALPTKQIKQPNHTKSIHAIYGILYRFVIICFCQLGTLGISSLVLVQFRYFRHCRKKSITGGFSFVVLENSKHTSSFKTVIIQSSCSCLSTVRQINY